MKFIRLFILSSFFLQSCGGNTHSSAIDRSSLKEAWDAENDPKLLRNQYEVRLSSLPLKAELKNKPWTDSYWPSYRGGIANRWNDPDHPSAFSYKLATQQQLEAMSEDELKKLSPAEKYDIYEGRLDYPMVKAERSRTHSNDPTWYGLCHGWAPASLNFEEPHPVVLMSRAGVKIPFGSSDVKALLIFAQQYGRDSRMVGNRCGRETNPEEPYSNDAACRDINAGSFHIIIANQIGIQAVGFVADVARDAQVWNQPVYGFESSVVNESNHPYRSAAPGTVKIVTVATEMNYTAELGANWQPRPFDEFPTQGGSKSFKYNLELNREGEIIGGEWLSEERPDFVWTQGKASFDGYLRDIAELYEHATHQ